MKDLYILVDEQGQIYNVLSPEANITLNIVNTTSPDEEGNISASIQSILIKEEAAEEQLQEMRALKEQAKSGTVQAEPEQGEE